MYADVAVCLPLSRTFVYRLKNPVHVGCRVLVPFRKREVEGFVVALRKDPPDGVEVHDVQKVLDSESLIRPDVFELCQWISDYYLAPPGEVLKSALPPGISAKHIDKHVPKTVGAVCDRANAPSLTADQARVLDLIEQSNGFHAILLHGVTGSGKTEVYLRAVESVLVQGKTALVLVPEIGLTPQLTERFAERFPERTAVLHSSLTKRRRIDDWLRI